MHAAMHNCTVLSELHVAIAIAIIIDIGLCRAVGSNSIMVRPKKGQHQSIRILALYLTIHYIQIIFLMLKINNNTIY